MQNPSPLQKQQQQRKWTEGMRVRTKDALESGSLDYSYCRNNLQIIEDDPLIGMLYMRIISELFADGLAYRINGKWKEPKDFWRSFEINHWEPFAITAFRNWLVDSYIIWSEVKTPSGFNVPCIPDSSLYRVTEEIVPNTSVYEVKASWHGDVSRGKLCVTARQNLLGLSNDFHFSLIKTAKPLVKIQNDRTIDTLLISHHNAEPVAIYEDMDQRHAGGNIYGSSATNGPLSGVTGRVVADVTKAMQDATLIDRGRVERLRQIQMQTDTTAVNDTIPFLTANQRLTFKKAQMIDDNVVLVPHGMRFVPQPMPTSDFDAVNHRRQISEEIRILFGNSPTDEIGNMKLSLMIGKIMSTYLTDIFNILYNPDAQIGADIKPTFRQEHRKLFEGGEAMDNMLGKGSDGDVKIEVFPRGYVKKNYVLYKQQFDQGIVDEYMFYEAFPMAREIAAEKEAQNMAREQMRMSEFSATTKALTDLKKVNGSPATLNKLISKKTALF